MGQRTAIQWCDSTINPTMGCDGCELWNKKNRFCYAGGLHRRAGNRNGFAEEFEEPEMFPGRTSIAAAWSDLTGLPRPDKPWLDGQPRLIFVSDMSDALSKDIPFRYLKNEVIDVVTSELGRRHHWLWLTKRPERMVKFSRFIRRSWPRNLWVGTSVTTQATTARLKHLRQVGDKHTIRFVSVEPQWQAISLGDFLPGLDWVIQGGQSGNIKNPFSIEWARSLRDECRVHGVPYFLKQLGACVHFQGTRIKLNDGHGGDWGEWPEDLRIREVPQQFAMPVRRPAIVAPIKPRRLKLVQVDIA